jgi:hypothetical protein
VVAGAGAGDPGEAEVVTVVTVVVVVVVVTVLLTTGDCASASPTAAAKGGVPGAVGAPTTKVACLPASMVTVPEALTVPFFFRTSTFSSDGGMFSKSFALFAGIVPTTSESRVTLTSSSV